MSTSQPTPRPLVHRRLRWCPACGLGIVGYSGAVCGGVVVTLSDTPVTR